MKIITDRNDPNWEPLAIDRKLIDEAIFALAVDAEGVVTIDCRAGVNPMAVAQSLYEIARVMASGGGMYIKADGVDAAEKFANGEVNPDGEGA